MTKRELRKQSHKELTAQDAESSIMSTNTIKSNLSKIKNKIESRVILLTEDSKGVRPRRRGEYLI
jgi:hypothetical protein